MDIREKHIRRRRLSAPVFGCVLIGGASMRMGTPKHLLLKDGKTWLERTAECLRPLTRQIVIAGTGDVPEPLGELIRLPDAADARGPMSGILAAMRWAPRVSWLVAACDLPDLTTDALRWLLSTRRPGVWATLPRLEPSGFVEPLPAHYDFRCRPLLEDLAGRESFALHELASHPKVASPVVPAHLAPAWRNANTPEDLAPRRR